MITTAKRLFVALAGTLLLSMALALVLAPLESVSAGGCVGTYTVRRGDTLTQIAQRVSVSLSELLAANQGGISDPDRIYVGQVLCLPQAHNLPESVPPMSQLTVSSKVVLEARYWYTLTDDEDRLELPRSGKLGKRVEIPLLPTHPVTVFTKTYEITQALGSELRPTLVGMRNRDADDQPANTYTLVAIGTGDLLGQLAISDTFSITPSKALDQAQLVDAFFGQLDINRAQVDFILEAENGVQMPFSASHLDVVPDYQSFKKFYLDPRPTDEDARVRADDIGFVLSSVGEGYYHLLLRLSSDGYGPLKWTSAERCGSWRYRQGRWFWFFRYFYRCPG